MDGAREVNDVLVFVVVRVELVVLGALVVLLVVDTPENVVPGGEKVLENGRSSCVKGNGDRPDIPPGQAPVRDDRKAGDSPAQVLVMQDSMAAMVVGSSQMQANTTPLIEKSTVVRKDGRE